MALNFPNNPADGEAFTFEGTQWVWFADPGVWGVAQSGNPVVIVADDTAAGWQVVGDVLIQWGAADNVPDGGVIVFPQPFAAVPTVLVTAALTVSAGSPRISSTARDAITPEQVTIRGWQIPNTGGSAGIPVTSTTNFSWIAIGEAPDALKKPKEITAAGGPTVTAGLVPVGGVMAFAMAAIPEGWLACDGTEIPRGQYGALYAAIGETYGAGNGTTTFNLPDLRGEFLRGLDSNRGVDPGRAIGTAQADALRSHTHPASSNSTGAHTHTVSGTAASGGAHTHTVSGTAASNGAHTHTIPNVATRTVPLSGGTDSQRLSRGLNDGAISSQALGPTGSSGAHTHTVSGTAASNGAHTHTVSGTAASNGAHSHTITVDASGGTETRPRNVAMSYCIRAI